MMQGQQRLYNGKYGISSFRYIRKEILLLPQERIYHIPFTLNLEADYLDSIRNPTTIHAMCEDYRAGQASIIA